MAPRKKAAGVPSFEGFSVPTVEFEITGGGTHETDVVAGDGDRVKVEFEGKVVNVKHPFKSGTVTRVQTVNVDSKARIVEILEKYVAPEPPGEDVPIPGVGDDA